MMLCAGAMFAIGLADDILNMDPQHKLAAQIVITSILMIFGFRLEWTLSKTANLFISIVWIIGITNAFNLLDNMDGLSAGVAAIATIFLFLIHYVNPNPGTSFVLLLSAAYLGALLGFLVYNFNPASIFMGDAGSLFIGFVMACLTAAGNGKGGERQRRESPVGDCHPHPYPLRSHSGHRLRELHEKALQEAHLAGRPGSFIAPDGGHRLLREEGRPRSLRLLRCIRVPDARDAVPEHRSYPGADRPVSALRYLLLGLSGEGQGLYGGIPALQQRARCVHADHRPADLPTEGVRGLSRLCPGRIRLLLLVSPAVSKVLSTIS